MTPDPGERVTAPEPLTGAHNLSAFGSGEAVLDDWLRRRALSNEGSGASRTYVVCAGGQVVGYYALATGAVALEGAIGRVRRNMPDPIPVMILARLAVDHGYHGQGIGRGLLKDAVLRTAQAARIGGIRAILVHAISDEAKRFYERHGFRESPIDPMMLMLRVSEAVRTIGRV